MNKALKIVVLSIILIFLTAFTIPIIFIGIVNAGNAAGILLCVLLMIGTLRFEHIINFFKKLCVRTPGKIATGAICSLLIFTVGLFIFASVQIVSAFHNPPEGETTVVVLGCKVNPNGPSLMLSQRIDAAYEFLVQNPDTLCIVSGGKGYDEPISEARCMYDELVKKGIDKNRIYIENSSMSTEENLRYSYEIIEKENLCRDITIITNDFHQKRASMLAKKMKIKCYNISGDTPISLFPTYFMREVGGVILELLF